MAFPCHDFQPLSSGAVLTADHRTDAAGWRVYCETAYKKGGRLIALWGSDERPQGEGYAIHAALMASEGIDCLTLPLEAERPAYPSIDDLFPAALRMQRAAYDLLGIFASGAADHREWLRHGAWPAGFFPLRYDFAGDATFPPQENTYPFVRVAGEGVHEIPVGPVHAGTIEPGHFRFSVIGERVLRLEERFGYTHKGVEKRFERLNLAEGVKLAGRVSGDSTVAYAWAYSMACESLAKITPPPRAIWLRALWLERERVANHLGDLGFLANDAAFAFGLTQFSCLKEDMLRTHHTLFGHRYLMDAIIPGGVRHNLNAQGMARIIAEIGKIEETLPILKEIYEDHAGLQDRFLGAGRVSPETALNLGVTGLAGRASGQVWDLRVQLPPPPYDQLDVHIASSQDGDVAARVAVRFDEAKESLRLIHLILDRMPGGDIWTPLPETSGKAFGLGLMEGWRGEVLVALHSDGEHIQRAHLHDPSWQNWPVLEHAILGNAVPDFPLINKSFNLSYSGHDL
ncbi:MAG TPA: Ni,Fe-hydrogenase III large subunit [Betaproteobacteria bacterium]|nr:Ni,Fe-hydrogenase III large subunit [Betaproteobacteria bacterium]